MQIKKRYFVGLLFLAMVGGWFTLGGTAYIMAKTSSTEFCISCHTMQIPFEEYQGSIHYSNSKGIRAECSDCHIPNDPIDYLITKIRASKDVYHEFVTGKIDTEEKYEEQRIAMAETVWGHMRENDSATCRSCHELDAMDTYEQTDDAVKMHQDGKENNLTCIDCHKGVAHFSPVPEMDSEAFDKLLSATQNTAESAKVVFTVEGADMGELGGIRPAVQLEVIQFENDKRQIKVAGYQMKGAEQLIYMAEGKRSVIADLTKAGEQQLTTGEFKSDEYGNEWRSAELTAIIDAPVLSSVEPLWTYAKELDNVYCSTCHAKVPANYFTVNAWGPVAKSKADQTDISDFDLEILTKYFQNHAKDMVGGSH
jgi:trimethylamine-N-oxide reductase (cytochrome c) cytochrome c-type subunit TorY